MDWSRGSHGCRLSGRLNRRLNSRLNRCQSTGLRLSWRVLALHPSTRLFRRVAKRRANVIYRVLIGRIANSAVELRQCRADTRRIEIQIVCGEIGGYVLLRQSRFSCGLNWGRSGRRLNRRLNRCQSTGLRLSWRVLVFIPVLRFKHRGGFGLTFVHPFGGLFRGKPERSANVRLRQLRVRVFAVVDCQTALNAFGSQVQALRGQVTRHVLLRQSLFSRLLHSRLNSRLLHSRLNRCQPSRLRGGLLKIVLHPKRTPAAGAEVLRTRKIARLIGV